MWLLFEFYLSTDIDNIKQRKRDSESQTQKKQKKQDMEL